MSSYAAVVADEEYPLRCGTDRDAVICDAMEDFIDAVDCGHREMGRYTVVVYTDPEWCEKQQRFCDEHDHEEYDRWLIGWAAEEDVEVEVCRADEDADAAWKEVADEE